MSDQSKPLQFFRRQQVCEMTGIASSTLYKMCAAGEFPKPFTIGKRSVAWNAEVVNAWMQEKAGVQL